MRKVTIEELMEMDYDNCISICEAIISMKKAEKESKDFKEYIQKRINGISERTGKPENKEWLCMYDCLNRETNKKVFFTKTVTATNDQTAFFNLIDMIESETGTKYDPINQTVSNKDKTIVFCNFAIAPINISE